MNNSFGVQVYDDRFSWADKQRFYGFLRNSSYKISGGAGLTIEQMSDVAMQCMFSCEDMQNFGFMDRLPEEVKAATSGRQALEIATTQPPPDLILLDVMMPEMDGYVLTQNIKADHRFEGIPVVMHSSLSSEANRDMGKRVGVDLLKRLRKRRKAHG